MNPKPWCVVFDWSAGLLIGLIPLLSHALVHFAGRNGSDRPEAWIVDLLFVAITTSGLSAVTLFGRLIKGSVAVSHLKPHSLTLMALNMVAFLLSGVLFGQVSSGAAAGLGLGLPVAFLVMATASSLYFEILIAIEVQRG